MLANYFLRIYSFTFRAEKARCKVNSEHSAVELMVSPFFSHAIQSIITILILFFDVRFRCLRRIVLSFLIALTNNFWGEHWTLPVKTEPKRFKDCKRNKHFFSNKKVRILFRNHDCKKVPIKYEKNGKNLTDLRSMIHEKHFQLPLNKYTMI